MSRAINVVSVTQGEAERDMKEVFVLAMLHVVFINMLAVCAGHQDMATSSASLKIGIVGYGHLGLNKSSKPPINAYLFNIKPTELSDLLYILLTACVFVCLQACTWWRGSLAMDLPLV